MAGLQGSNVGLMGTAVDAGASTGASAAQQYQQYAATGGGQATQSQFMNPAQMAQYQQQASTQYLNGQQQLAQAQNYQGNSAQQALQGSLMGTINGTQPTAANIQMQQGQQQGINAAQAAVNSNSAGLSPGLAAHEAGNQASSMQQQNVNNNALLNANQIASAQGQLNTLGSNVGSQQLGLIGAGNTATNNGIQSNLAGQTLATNQGTAYNNAADAYLQTAGNQANQAYATSVGGLNQEQQNSDQMYGAIAQGVGSATGGIAKAF